MHFVIVPRNQPFASIYFDSIKALFDFIDSHIAFFTPDVFRRYSLFRCPDGLVYYAKNRFNFYNDDHDKFYICQLDDYVKHRSMYNKKFRKYLKRTYYGVQKTNPCISRYLLD